MAGEAHSLRLENEIETTETAAPPVPRGRGRPRRPRTSTNPQLVAQRINRLEGAVLNLSNMMAQFVATMTNAQDAPIPAAARPPSTQDNSIGHEDQDPAQVASGDQAARRARNPEASQSRTRGESQRTRVSVFDRLEAENEDETDSTWTPDAARSAGDLRDHINQRRGGALARLGPNPAPSHQSASRRIDANLQGSRVSRASAAHAINRAPAAAPVENLEEVVRRLIRQEQGTHDIIGEIESPFTEQVLAEPFPEDFKMPVMKQYEGLTDPINHFESYRTWMNVRRASPNIKCQAFGLTLTGAALEWFHSLQPRSIASFGQLRTEFVNRFIGQKTRKNDKTYLWSLKQGKNESLKDYVRRFTKEINTLEKFTDGDAIAALREGLQEGELLRSMIRKEPKTFNEFLTRAHEYIKVDDYLQTRQEHKGEKKRASETETEETKKQKSNAEFA